MCYVELVYIREISTEKRVIDISSVYEKIIILKFERILSYMKKRAFLSILCILFLSYRCTHPQYCTTSDSVQKQYIIIQGQDIDSSTYRILKPYKIKINNDLNIKIAYTDKPLEKNNECNNLAQLVYESMEWFADSLLHNQSNFYVLINYGGLRANIPQGDVLKSNIFELMPFDNSIVILELTDEQKNELLSKAKENKKLLLKSKNNQTTMLLVTSDYLYQGGDNCEFLKKCKPIHITRYFIRDAIIRYCIIKKQLNINCFY